MFKRLCLVLAVVTALGGILMAQSPGTSSDPLVTKSYIDHFIRFRSLVIPADNEVQPEPGAMLVVRSGKLLLDAPAGKSVIDLTAGEEIMGGTELPLNHLIIIPDSAGYMLKAQSLTMLLASALRDQESD